MDRWVYWSRGPTRKAGAKAGVYNRTTKHAISVPSCYAELADGYRVSHNETAATLEITYFPGAVPPDRVGTSTLGPLKDQVGALADRRGRFWAVDRSGRPVAYLTDTGDVTVTWPQRWSPPPPCQLPTDSPADMDPRTDGSQHTRLRHLPTATASRKPVQNRRPTANRKLTITAGSGRKIFWELPSRNGTLNRCSRPRSRLTAAAGQPHQHERNHHMDDIFGEIIEEIAEETAEEIGGEAAEEVVEGLFD
ncbi:hypothetical protein [Streptomyces odonnellii]|uniref:hypothetical protein n=1 Tax=Streptomyces odonnellii TaxID=1417980 RepID=UPI0012FED741|nr:hypothetical protein [Streptomyces odonnellii]